MTAKTKQTVKYAAIGLLAGFAGYYFYDKAMDKKYPGRKPGLSPNDLRYDLINLRNKIQGRDVEQLQPELNQYTELMSVEQRLRFDALGPKERVEYFNKLKENNELAQVYSF